LVRLEDERFKKNEQNLMRGWQYVNISNASWVRAVSMGKLAPVFLY
jgi:hypothetical protein